MLCSLHVEVFKVTKAMVHMFLILSFSCSHFHVYYWDTLKKKEGDILHMTVICCWDAIFILPVISWSFSLFFLPHSFTCSFHILQFRPSSGIKKNFSSSS